MPLFQDRPMSFHPGYQRCVPTTLDGRFDTSNPILDSSGRDMRTPLDRNEVYLDRDRERDRLVDRARDDLDLDPLKHTRNLFLPKTSEKDDYYPPEPEHYFEPEQRSTFKDLYRKQEKDDYYPPEPEHYFKPEPILPMMPISSPSFFKPPREDYDDVPEDPAQYVERYGAFQTRIDPTHDELHFNQDILGLSKKRQKRLMKEDWEDWHHRDL